MPSSSLACRGMASASGSPHSMGKLGVAKKKLGTNKDISANAPRTLLISSSKDDECGVCLTSSERPGGELLGQKLRDLASIAPGDSYVAPLQENRS